MDYEGYLFLKYWYRNTCVSFGRIEPLLDNAPTVSLEYSRPSPGRNRSFLARLPALTCAVSSYHSRPQLSWYFACELYDGVSRNQLNNNSLDYDLLWLCLFCFSFSCLLNNKKMIVINLHTLPASKFNYLTIKLFNTL